MPRKLPRQPKASVDDPVPEMPDSPSEGIAAPKVAARDSGVAGTRRAHGADFTEAAAFIGQGKSADRGHVEDSRRCRIEQQARAEEWARAQGCLIDARVLDALVLISNSTSEHEVRYRASDNRVVKTTWPGFFGQVPVWEHGRVGRAAALPAEYLLRQHLQNVVFHSGLRLEGVHLSSKPSMIIGEPAGQPSFVISQPFIESLDEQAPAPMEEQISTFLTAHGFASISSSYFGWLRATDGVVLLDARRDNFILSPEGIVPIDLQMAVIPQIAPPAL